MDVLATVVISLLLISVVVTLNLEQATIDTTNGVLQVLVLGHLRQRIGQFCTFVFGIGQMNASVVNAVEGSEQTVQAPLDGVGDSGLANATL